MASRKKSFVDKILERMDRIDSGSLQAQFARLAQQKGLLETIVQSMMEGLVVLDAGGGLTYANSAAEALLGFELGTALGQPVERVLRGIDLASLRESKVPSGSRLRTREIEVAYPRRRILESYVVPLAEDTPGGGGTVLILRDVTKDREQSAAALESERLNAVMLLAAGVAHEIGNPLNSLNIHLQLLDRELAYLPQTDRDNLQELVSVARGEVSRLDQIITQFLGAVRPTEPKMEPTSLAQLVRDTLAVMKQEADDRGVWIEIEAAAGLPPAEVDKGQLRQAFFNIAKNALQAMGKGGLLRVRVAAEEQWFTVTFTDTGSGITPENLRRIFEPYHTTKAGGTGLGLMIVQRIIQDHGGHIGIDTEPGKGTTFTLALPRDRNRVRLLEPGNAGGVS